MRNKERIMHRKPWLFGGNPDHETIETFYKFHFNKDYVLKDDNGEVIAISSSKKRLRKVK